MADTDTQREIDEGVAATAKALREPTRENIVNAVKEDAEAVVAVAGSGWSWQKIAVAVMGAVIVAFVGVGTVAMVMRDANPPTVVSVPAKADPDLAKLLTDGFAKLDKSLTTGFTTLGKKLDEKPVPLPVDPDKPKPPPVVQGITLPSTVNIGGGHVSIKAVSAGAVTWFTPTYDALTIDTFGDVAIVSAKIGSNGTYWIGATTVIGGKVAPPAYCAITVNQGPQPPPKPDPTPTPVPPSPLADRLTIVVVWESANPNSVAKVMSDYAFWKSLEPIGVTWFKIDKDQKDAGGGLLVDTHAYRPHMTKHGIPTILYMDKTGLVLRSAALPDNTAAIRATITELMGK